jgi:uncharacterized protein YacL
VGLLILRILLLAATGASGYFLAQQLAPFPEAGLWGMGAGLALGLLVILIERGIRRIPLKVTIGGAIGFILGLMLANVLINSFFSGILEGLGIQFSGYFLINSALGYLGLLLGLKKGKEFDPARLPWVSKRAGPGCDGHKVLDTSVIIDGRIADICDTGFVEGTFIIPQFILQELQHIADSSDPLKRGRGRRGLDVLNRIQKQSSLEVKIVDQDYPKIQEVDAKLIALAKDIHAKIVTNDFNLNKVAELQGIPVLNINQLFNALKPVVLPGEVMNVKILKEGKEPGQGVAYLDDGTMVVVDNARRYMGKSVDVTVTSVLQTTAGRMIFTILKEDAPESSYQSFTH